MNNIEVKRDEMEHHDKVALKQVNPMGEYKPARVSWDIFISTIPQKCIKNKIILDMGCGDGRFVRYSVDKGAKLDIGIDISQKYILAGIKKRETLVYTHKITEYPPKNTLYLQGDVERTPIKSNSIDTIFCLLTFHHFPNKELFLNECNRILVRGGSLIIVDPNETNPLRRLLNYGGRKCGAMSKYEEATKPKEVGNLLVRHGFEMKAFFSLNMLSEINCHIASMFFDKRLGAMGSITRSFLIFTNLFDRLMERILLNKFPIFGHKYILISELVGSGDGNE